MTAPDAVADAGPVDDRDAWLSGPGHEVGVTAGSYTVTPATGLGYSEDVTVEGSGYAPSSVFGALECVAGATGFEDCNTSSLVIMTTDGAGDVSFTVSVRRFFFVNGTVVDCADAPGTCVVAAGPSFADALLDTTPLTFDPSAPIPPDPVIVATPNSDLGLETTVDITGSGFDPDDFVSIQQCIVGATDFSGCSQLGGAFTIADPSGEISTDLVVHRGIRTANDPVVDCLDPPGCELIAFMFSDPFRRGHAALAFDPSVPIPPPPTLDVTPSTGLADRQFVSVSASGFDPGESVFSGECAAGSVDSSTCGPFRIVTADANGSIAYSFRVHRTVGFPSIDCQDAPGTCIVFAASVEDVFKANNVPLEFDPNAPPVPPPTLTIDPSTGLHDGDVVAVEGDEFTPGEQVALLECRNGPADDTGGNCDIAGTLKYATVDQSGAVHTTFTVRRHLKTRNFGDVDCVTDPNGCMLGFGGTSDLEFERGNVPLPFAPDPAPPSTGPPATGLPATGAPSRRLAAVALGLILLGALLLVAVRRRACPTPEWQSEVDTLA
jgi:LPXTG-motif cell wall-anchored protein